MKTKIKIHVQKIKKIKKTHSSTVYKCGLRRMQQIGVGTPDFLIIKLPQQLLQTAVLVLC